MSTTVLAVGAWLKNAACLVLRGQAHWSPEHGDLSDPAACEALAQSVQSLVQQATDAGAPVQAIAHDLHPDFFSTQLAIATAAALGVPAIGVQHHHAHLAAGQGVGGAVQKLVECPHRRGLQVEGDRVVHGHSVHTYISSGAGSNTRACFTPGRWARARNSLAMAT